MNAIVRWNPGVGSAAVDLQNFGVPIDEGDALLARDKFENAVLAYQAAGNQSGPIGAEINPTDPAVIQAASLNQTLQGLQWHLASKQTATQAQGLAKQIQASLADALARNPQANPPANPTPVVTPPAKNPNQLAITLLWGGVAAGLLFLGYTIFKGPKENPTSGGGSRRKRSGSLIAKGRACLFEMVDGSDVKCAGGMLHDPSGRWWPARSVLIGPFRARLRKATDDEFRGEAKQYFGGDYNAQMGTVNTPPKALSGWRYVGEVERIYYTRSGRRGGRYQHPFNEGLQSLLYGKKSVRLYRRGKFCRLELPRGARLDDRGFIRP
jgi:hypothetical protein